MFSRIFVNENYLTVEIDYDGIFNLQLLMEAYWPLTLHEKFKLVPIYGEEALHGKNYAKIHPPGDYITYLLSFSFFKNDFYSHFHFKCVDRNAQPVIITPAIFAKIFNKFYEFQNNPSLRKEIREKILLNKKKTGKPIELTIDELETRIDFGRKFFPNEELSSLKVSFSKHEASHSTPSFSSLSPPREDFIVQPVPAFLTPLPSPSAADTLPSHQKDTGISTSFAYGTLLLVTVGITFFATKCLRKNRAEMKAGAKKEGFDALQRKTN